jgi:hypothetical protein
MSKRRHYETDGDGSQRHPNRSRSGVDDESLPAVIEGETTWHALAAALTDCPECARQRATAVSDPEDAVRRWRAPKDAGVERDDDTRFETDTGTQSTTLGSGTVATFYAGVSSDTDSLSVHVHFGSDHTVELIDPNGTVERSADPVESPERAVGVRTWTVEEPDPGQWSVQMRAPTSGEKRGVTVTFGTLTERRRASN